MKTLFATLALVLLGGCTSSPEPRYGINTISDLKNREQTELQLIERSLNLQTIDKKLDIPIKIIHAPLPDYPDFLRAEKIHGTVHIRFMVEEDGTVSNPQVLGAPPAPLAAISINALLNWRFLPIFIAGKPSRVQLIQPFIYMLAP